MAARAGNENVRIDLGPANLGDLAPIVDALEEPLADSAVLPLWYLCRGTAEHVKVALSGEGGDEVLGGYARYFWGPVVDDSPAAAPAPRGRGPGRSPPAFPSRSLGIFNVARRAAKLATSVQLDTPTRYLAWFDIFTSDERRALVGDGPDAAAARYETLFDSARELRLDPVQRLQYVDCQTMLLDNLLMKADKISMAHSLEVRVPFLSRQLVEFGLGLAAAPARSGSCATSASCGSSSSRGSGCGWPTGPSAGFEIPVDRWFREPCRRRAPRAARARAAGQRARVRRRPPSTALLDRHMGGEDVGRKLFALTALERWAQRFA